MAAKEFSETLHGKTVQWQNKVTTAAKDATIGWSNNLASKLDKIKLPGSDNRSVEEKLQLEKIDIRSKIKIECPDFLKQCGLTQIDFGTVFLRPQDEAFISQATNIVNDAISTVNGISAYLTPEAYNAVVEVIQFIIADLIQTVVSYAMRVFQTYVSPDFVIGLAQDIVTQSLRYTAEKTRNPAEILEEIKKDRTKIIEDEAEKKKKEGQLALVKDINDTLAKVTKDVQKVMDEIQPYTSEIAKYMEMGPDYALTQLENLYNKYLNMGISIVDQQLGKVNQMIDDYVDSGAKATGYFAAQKINSLQEKQLKKVAAIADTKLQQVKIKALSLINKAVMNLMAMLGG